MSGPNLVPGVRLAELAPGQCRFAVTPDDVHPRGHRFCGQPVVEGTSWCAEHKAIVYGPWVHPSGDGLPMAQRHGSDGGRRPAAVLAALERLCARPGVSVDGLPTAREIVVYLGLEATGGMVTSFRRTLMLMHEKGQVRRYEADKDETAGRAPWRWSLP